MLETLGWDTHSAQKARLANQLKNLDAMLAALRDGLGARVDEYYGAWWRPSLDARSR